MIKQNHFPFSSEEANNTSGMNATILTFIACVFAVIAAFRLNLGDSVADKRKKFL